MINDITVDPTKILRKMTILMYAYSVLYFSIALAKEMIQYFYYTTIKSDSKTDWSINNYKFILMM